MAVRNVIGFSPSRAETIRRLVIGDFVIQGVLIVLGLILFFDWGKVVDPIDLGTTPSWGGLAFALGLVTVVFTGLESASGLAGEVAVGRRGLKRIIAAASAR